MIEFHGYVISRYGHVFNSKGKILKQHKRDRRGGGFDMRVTLYVRGKRRNFTVQRLVAACYLGPIYGYEINHKDRNPLNNNVDNLERITPSENQIHWRNCEISK